MKNTAEEYDGFWARLTAFSIDVTLCFIIPFTIASLIYGATWWNSSEGELEFKWEGAGVLWRDWVDLNLNVEITPEFFLGKLIVLYLLPAVYFIWFNSAKSATPGKAASSRA